MSTVPTLHVLADLDAGSHPQFERVLEQLSSDQNSALHVRDGLASGRALAALAVRAFEAGVTCIVNDRVDVALASKSHGVHLPAQGLPTDSTRSMIGERLIGRSTHGLEEMSQAVRDGADYVFLGPIWPTTSHPGKPALGIDALQVPSASQVIGIGGVNADRVRDCLAAGFRGVATIGAVWNAEDPADAIRALQLLLNDEQYQRHSERAESDRRSRDQPGRSPGSTES